MSPVAQVRLSARRQEWPAGFEDMTIRSGPRNPRRDVMRRKFSRKFKIEAVLPVTDRGVAVAQATRDLDVAESVLPGAVRRMRTGLRYPNPDYGLGSEKVAPPGESGGAGLLVSVAVLEVALLRKVVVDRGMHLGELL